MSELFPRRCLYLNLAKFECLYITLFEFKKSKLNENKTYTLHNCYPCLNYCYCCFFIWNRLKCYYIQNVHTVKIVSSKAWYLQWYNEIYNRLYKKSVRLYDRDFIIYSQLFLTFTENCSPNLIQNNLRWANPHKPIFFLLSLGVISQKSHV